MFNRIMTTASLVVIGIALGTGAEIGKAIGKVAVREGSKKIKDIREGGPLFYNELVMPASLDKDVEDAKMCGIQR